MDILPCITIALGSFKNQGNLLLKTKNTKDINEKNI